MYRHLDCARILDTSERLERRIGERFPGSGLGRVAAELTQVVRERDLLLRRLARPIWPIRAGAAATVALLVMAVQAVVRLLGFAHNGVNIPEALQGTAALLDTV